MPLNRKPQQEQTVEEMERRVDVLGRRLEMAAKTYYASNNKRGSQVARLFENLKDLYGTAVWNLEEKKDPGCHERKRQKREDNKLRKLEKLEQETMGERVARDACLAEIRKSSNNALKPKKKIEKVSAVNQKVPSAFSFGKKRQNTLGRVDSARTVVKREPENLPTVPKKKMP
jgi:hypothetical protein